MITADLLRAKFDAAHAYPAYLDTAKPNERENWNAFARQVSLTKEQRSLIAGFARRMPVLCISGTWCGDCVQQVPILAAIAAANPAVIDLRLVDRDVHTDLADQVRICGGLRVPTVIFMNEDYEFVSILGDRTLSRYRAIAARQLGPSCPLPGAAVPPDELAAGVSDWIGEFERVNLLLRLSAKLRQRHND